MDKKDFMALALVRLDRAKELYVEAKELVKMDSTAFTKTDYQKIAKADRIRNASDYDDFYIVNKEETRELLEFVKEFLERTAEYIHKTG